MKKIDILPQGVRRISGEQDAGPASCDNMLNLRYEYNTLKVVGDKKVEYQNINYERFYEHRIMGTVNHIAVYESADSVFIIRDITNGQDVHRFTPVENNYDITFVNNLMIVKMPESDLGGDGYRIMTFIWRDGQYSLFYNGQLPDTPTYTIDLDTNWNTESELLYDVELLDTNQFFQQVKAMENKFRLLNNDDYTQGAVLVCCNFTLFDGSQTRPSPPRIITTELVDNTDNYYVRYFGETSATMKLSVSLLTSAIKLTPSISSDFYAKHKDIIKSINFYSTMPKKFYEIESLLNNADYKMSLDNFFELVRTDTSGIQLTIGDLQEYSDDGRTSKTKTIPIQKVDMRDIGNELFYLQKSIPLTESTDNMNEQFTLMMSEDLMSSTVMNVDASGYFRMYGDMLMYNNRLHLYNIKRKFVCGGSNFDWGCKEGSVSYTASAMVYIKTDIKTLKYFFQFDTKPVISETEKVITDFISFPDSRAYKVEIFFSGDGSDYSYDIPLTPSKTQNFAYFYGSEHNQYSLGIGTAPFPTATDADLIFDNYDTILVSAQSNPAYFDNSNSYRVGGNITSLSVVTDGVSDLQIGRFPIAVFTDNGIYSMEQGSGEILYSNIIKISEIVAVSKSLQTKMGVFFLADKGVYNLSGRVTTRISDLIEGEPDRDIRKCPNYTLICDSNLTYKAEILPNIRDYCTEYAVLAYDNIEDELFVSSGVGTANNAISFVYNVKTKEWHSVDFTIYFANGRYALAKKYLSGNGNDIIDLNTEVFSDDYDAAQVFHLQTRALTFGSYDYKAIHRMIARCDISTNDISAHGMVGIYLFGSNDIKSWYLIGASQHNNGYTDKLQIQKVANNYKYFIIIIGGYANEHSVINRTEVMFTNKFSNKLR